MFFFRQFYRGTQCIVFCISCLILNMILKYGTDWHNTGNLVSIGYATPLNTSSTQNVNPSENGVHTKKKSIQKKDMGEEIRRT